LFLDGRDDFRVPKSDLMNRVSMEVQDLSSLMVKERRAMTPFQDVQARSGEGLMKKDFRVFVEYRLGFLIEMPRGPFPAFRG